MLQKKWGQRHVFHSVTSPFMLATLCKRLETEDINCNCRKWDYFPFLFTVRLQLLQNSIVVFHASWHPTRFQWKTCPDCRLSLQSHTVGTRAECGLALSYWMYLSVLMMPTQVWKLPMPQGRTQLQYCHRLCLSNYVSGCFFFFFFTLQPGGHDIHDFQNQF